MACRYAGIDWASDKHDVLVADQNGAELLAATYAHDEQGLTALCGALVRWGVEFVAIERPDGVLVERLLDAGLRVLALHPNKRPESDRTPRPPQTDAIVQRDGAGRVLSCGVAIVQSRPSPARKETSGSARPRACQRCWIAPDAMATLDLHVIQ